MTLVWLLMPLSIQSSLFLTPELFLLVPFPLYKILREEWVLFQKYMNLLTKIHDILDNAMSKQVGNMAHILAHFLFCCQAAASNLGFTVPLSSQSHGHGSSQWGLPLGLYKLIQCRGSATLVLSFPPMGSGNARPMIGFHFNMPKRIVSKSSVASLAKRPHLESMTEAYPDSRKSNGGRVSASYTDSWKKRSHAGWCSWCATVNNLIIHLFLL